MICGNNLLKPLWCEIFSTNTFDSSRDLNVTNAASQTRGTGFETLPLSLHMSACLVRKDNRYFSAHSVHVSRATWGNAREGQREKGCRMLECVCERTKQEGKWIMRAYVWPCLHRWVQVCALQCACVCVCVRKWERKKERKGTYENVLREQEKKCAWERNRKVCEWVWVYVCVSVCVCVRERERGKSERDGKSALLIFRKILLTLWKHLKFIFKRKKFNECVTVSDIQIQTTPRDSFLYF